MSLKNIPPTYMGEPAPKRGFIQKIFDHYQERAIGRYAKQLELHNALGNAAVKINEQQEQIWELRQRLMIQRALVMGLIFIIAGLAIRAIKQAGV